MGPPLLFPLFMLTFPLLDTKSHLGFSEIAGISEDSAGFKKGEDLVGEFVVNVASVSGRALPEL